MDSKKYCKQCGRELTGFELGWGWEHCHECGSEHVKGIFDRLYVGKK